MTLFWCVTGASLAAALGALWQARRTAQRLERLSQMYWELKYQNGELRVQLERMTGGAAPPGEGAKPAAPPLIDGFVPLTSVKR